MTWKDEILKDSAQKKLDEIRFFLMRLSEGRKYTAEKKLKIGEEIGVGDALMGLYHKRGE
jgi:pyruvate formate-lyase activating enzyme-like uncharacterized protein